MGSYPENPWLNRRSVRFQMFCPVWLRPSLPVTLTPFLPPGLPVCPFSTLHLERESTDDRNGLLANACGARATGTCEREAAIEMIRGVPGDRRLGVRAGKACDGQVLWVDCRKLNVALHVAHKKDSSTDGWTIHPEDRKINPYKRESVATIQECIEMSIKYVLPDSTGNHMSGGSKSLYRMVLRVRLPSRAPLDGWRRFSRTC